MKIFFTFFLSLIIISSLFAQNEPDFAWGKLIGTAGNTGIIGVTVDKDGNYYIQGRANKTINFGNGVVIPNSTPNPIGFLAKFDNSGTCLWAEEAFYNTADSKRSMVIDDDGNIYIAGSFRNGGKIGNYTVPAIPNTYNGYMYLAVAKLDPNGNVVWFNPIHDYIGNYVPPVGGAINWWSLGQISIRFNPQGQLFVSGGYQSDLSFYSANDTLNLFRSDTLPATVFLATYTTSGNLLQVENLPTELTDSSFIPTSDALEEIIELDALGNIYRFTMRTNKITKYDPQLNVIDSHTVSEYCTVTDNATTEHKINNFTVDRAGDIYLISRFRGGSNMSINTQITYHIEGFDIPKTGNKGAFDGILTKLNGTTFVGEWFAQYIASGDDYFQYVTTDELNNVYAAGGITFVGGLIMKYNPNGQKIWDKIIKTGTATPLTSNLNASIMVQQIFLSSDGGNILAFGTTQNRIQMDGVVTEFPNIQKAFVIQYGICNTEKPLISATPNTSFCVGDSVMLVASGSTGNYIWNTGETTSSIYTDKPLTYHAIAQEDSVCYGKSNSLTLDRLPLPDAQITVSDSVICEGNEVILTASGADEINWDNNVQNGSPFTPTSTQEFTVTITDTNGCNNTASQLVTVNELPNVSVTEENNVLTAIESTQGTSYQWLNCETNTEIYGATEQIFIPTENGEYAVVVTSENGCLDTSSCHMINTLSVENNPMLTKQITLYPNPTSNEINIQTDLDISEIYVLDLQGKQLQKTTSKEVDLSKLTSGIYLIKVKLKNNETWTNKVIKN